MINRHHFIVGLYSLCIFLSAFLVFWIQPLISKQLTPIMGGTPMVWNTLLFLFQFLLLVGYAYVFWLMRWFSVRVSLMLHGIFSIAVLFFLPVHFNFETNVPNSEFPFWWIIVNVFSGIGVPFIFLAATAPLFQIWYVLSQGAHNQGKQPYFLYAVSNIGSFSALFLFLFFIEAYWGIKDQFHLWSLITFCLVIAIIFANIKTFLKSKFDDRKIEKTTSTINLRDKLVWLLLAFIPASLLHGVTFYITNDLFSLPLLWLIPLGLYLLTFVITFTQKGDRYHTLFKKFFLPVIILPLIYSLWVDPAYSIILLVLHLIMFVVLSLVCHGLLYKNKPQDDAQLSAFYLWLAAGGALGGFLNAIVAPVFFDSILEYPLSIALAVLTVLFLSSDKNISYSKWNIVKHIVVPLVFSAFLLIVYIQSMNFLDFVEGFERQSNIIFTAIVAAISIAIIAYTYFYRRNAVNLSIFVLMLFVLTATTTMSSLFGISFTQKLHDRQAVYIKRNFYSIIRVVDEMRYGEPARSYYNGTVRHNHQSHGSSVRAFSYNPQNSNHFMINAAYKRGLPVASMGMGPAHYQCYLRGSDQKIDYFEINPAVVKMAKDYFDFLEKCPGDESVYIGDARLQLSQQSDEKYGAIISSIYWSNTIPFHLFTQQAMETYIKKLAPGGYFKMIMPKHFFDSTPLFAAYSEVLNIIFYEQHDGGVYYKSYIFQKPYADGRYDEFYPSGWQSINLDKKIPVWTDDHHSIIPLIRSTNQRYTKDNKRLN